MAVLKQTNNAPVEVEHQVCILYAVTNGYLNDVAVDQIAEFELQLRELMDNRYEKVLQSIKTSGKLEESAEESLKAALEELLVQFVEQ